MHLQTKFSQGKFLSVLKGEIFDVVVDLRKNSKRFGKHYCIRMSDTNGVSIYIPPGFAHGFQVLEEDSQIIYTHSKEYSNEFEGGISPLDPEINVPWPLPVIGLSERDKNLPLAKDFI